jgi:carbon storage regulator
MNESVVIDGRIKLTVIEIRGNQIRLGIEAPRDVSIARSELIGSGAMPALAVALLQAPEPLPIG